MPHAERNKRFFAMVLSGTQGSIYGSESQRFSSKNIRVGLVMARVVKVPRRSTLSLVVKLLKL